MRIKNFPSRMMDTNCYVISSGKDAIVIDPGEKEPKLLDYITEEDLTVEAIILTHGHYDHIAGVEWLKDNTHAPVICGKDEVKVLSSPTYNLSPLFGGGELTLVPDRTLEDNEEVTFGELKFKTIFTPGHTEGGICLYFENEMVLVSGDTLFAMSIGRTDFPGGSYRDIVDSLKNRLMPLPDDTIVLPGHGPKTTIATEKRLNPYMRG